jgi:hemolysin-activating ACP:hemolysin acyltransferase
MVRIKDLTQTTLNVPRGDQPLFERFELMVGIVVGVMARSPKYAQFPIACLVCWIYPAVLHKQIYLFRNDQGAVVGYMTWAMIDADTEARFLFDPKVLFHLSEWNEGDRLWITDFVVLYGDVRARIQEAYKVLSQYRSANSLRRRDDGTAGKVTTWNATSADTLLARRWRGLKEGYRA